MSLPEVRASRAVLLALAANALVSGRDGGTYTPGAGAETAGAAAAPADAAGTPGSAPGTDGVEQPTRPGVGWRNLCKPR